MSELKSKNKNIHAGHRRRMFEKLHNGGINAFADHELLEMLLYYVNSQKNTNIIAHDLLSQFGTFSGVFDAEMHDLVKVDGVGKRSAEFIHFIHELFGKYYEGKTQFTEVLSTTQLQGDFLKSKYLTKTKEEFSILTLDGKGCFLGFHVLQSGCPCHVNINTRMVVETAIADQAHYVVLCHNHPNNLALPSKDDVATTLSLSRSLLSIEIPVIDHIIIAGDDYVSMASSREYDYIFSPGIVAPGLKDNK